ncbi:MAG: OmpA family protein [Pseudomonadota bacterium]
MQGLLRLIGLLWLTLLPALAAAQDLATINFDFDSDQLDAQALAEVARIAERLRETPSYRPTVVVGHTDAVGSLAYNDNLGLRRARNTAAALEAAGVPVSRIGVVESRGKRDLLVQVATRERANRRVTVRLDQALAACRSYRQIPLEPAQVNELLQNDLIQRTAEAVAVEARLRGSGGNPAAYQMAGAAVEDCGTAQGYGMTQPRKREYAKRCLCSSARMQAALGR